MKKFRLLPLLLLALAFTLNCCKNGNGLVQVSAGFADEIRQAQNLVFLFSEDIYDGGKEGEWLAKEYIKFSPDVKGKFQWKSKKELVFSPEKGFAPSTKYEAKVQKNVLEESKEKSEKLDGEHTTFHFSTPLLNAEHMDIYWGQDKQGKLGLITRINFNYEVQAPLLQNLVSFDLNGSKTSSSLTDTKETGKEITFSLPVEVSKDDHVTLKATVKKGVKLASGAYETSSDKELIASIASRGKLEILEVKTVTLAQNSEIQIKTSQQVDAATIAGAITVTPEVTFTSEVKDNYVILKGHFVNDVAYVVHIAKTLKGIAGGTMDKDYSSDISFKEPDPEISFISTKGMYLSSAGFKNIALNVLNVKAVNIKIYKVYENNILPYTRSSNNYYYYEEDGYGGEESYNEDINGWYSDIVMDRKVNTSELPDVDGYKLLHLDIPQNNSLRGVYYVRVSSADDYYVRASKLVSVSDIGLIVKESRNGIMIYAHSILNAEPMKNVDVSVISTNNQLITTATTDSKGIAMIKDLEEKKGDFIPHMVTARTGADFNFLLFSKAYVESSRFDVEGARSNKAGLDAFIYGDRNLYRPGDTIHFNTILRDTKRKTIASHPLHIKILQPNGLELANMRKETDREGAVNIDVPVATGALTGYYTIEVYNGSEVLLNSRSINVEEFMPDRISVRLNTDKEKYKINEKAKIEVVAQNYFGPPAADRKVEVELAFSRKYFSPKGYEKYDFNNNNRNSLPGSVYTLTTNSAGVATQEYQVPSTFEDMGILEAKIYATVFDETGRPVNRSHRFDIGTQETMFGIFTEDYYVKTNANTAISFAALNVDGKPVNATAEIEIIRYEWQNSLYRYSSRYGYNSNRMERIVYHKEVQISGGNYTMNFSPPISGEYEIRIKRPDATYFASYRMYSYSYGSTSSTSFNVNTEGTVDITFDKEKYNPGDEAKILFKAPFNGKLLVTLEKDQVVENFELQTKDRTAELKLKINKEYLPNIYVAATLIKPLANSEIPLMVAHGYNSLAVEDAKTKLPIQILAQETSRSTLKQTIKIKTTANTPVTIAVVDEGILALKDYKTPDPHGFFYAKRALEVSSYDVYPYLFPEIGTKSSTGGDRKFMSLDKRVNPLANPRVKLLSYWSGILVTNGSGEVSYTIDIPKFSGQLRIMAVAYKDEAFASAEKSLTVADPLVVVTALPRFLSPGDIVEMPVSINNTTAKNANVQATVKIEGPISMGSVVSQSLIVNSKRENTAQFRISANNNIGIAKISVEVKGLGETFTDVTEITVRPASSLVKLSGSAGIQNTESAQIDFKADWLAGTDDHKLIVSRNPLYGFGYKLRDLLGYPHGCLEQTVSKAFPQLYFTEFINNMYKGGGTSYTNLGANELNPEFNVKSAIERIQSMQQYDGSYTYWPGGSYQNKWSCAYATHFLIEAEKAGFNISKSVKTSSLDYMLMLSNTREEENYYFYESGNYPRSTVRSIPARHCIYSLYVLAVAGKPNFASMNYYKNEAGKLVSDQLYMLAAAYKLAGDQRSAKELIPKFGNTENALRNKGGDFSSNIRNISISLNALLETDPAHPDVMPLTQSLCRQLGNERYWNTQELGFSFLALGKIAKNAVKSTAKVKVMVDGSLYKEMNSNENLILNTKELRGKTVTLNGEGSGMAYYSWYSEGISTSGNIKEEDNLIRVRKTFYDRFGSPVNGNGFKQGDLIMVKLAVTSLDGSTVENVAITDILPAAFEIDNPRISDERNYAWLTDRQWPQHYDIRDDRINYFSSVYANTTNLYYLVRVVSKGTFNMGPVGADAMYDGNYHSYSGAGKIVVQ